LIAQRDPIWTAKEVASLDHLSGGRLILGVGYGWNKEEMANHGTPYLKRRAVMREKILTMKALWTEDEAHFEGELMNLEKSWTWPKPIQKPHPPIVMGAAPGPKTLEDIVEYCDGWMPLAGRHDISGQVSEVRRAVADAGRDPAAFEVTAYGAKVDRIDALEDAGIDRAVFSLPPLGADVVLPKLDEWAGAVGLI
jgi:probable F420-dependent oxidoreductase